MAALIHNRDSFLDGLAAKLGRERNTQGVDRTPLPHTCHLDVMADFSQAELADELLHYAKEKLGALAVSCNKAELIDTLTTVCHSYIESETNNANRIHAEKIVLSGDQRLVDLNINAGLKSRFSDVYVWDKVESAQVNIHQAEQARIGVVFVEQALAESGTMVLHSDASYGRSVSLLPQVSVFLIPQSKIAPRLTQATQRLHAMAEKGERIPSCVNFISGPSSTADIELIKVVGVHGPMHAAYIIIDDM